MWSKSVSEKVTSAFQMRWERDVVCQLGVTQGVCLWGLQRALKGGSEAVDRWWAHLCY